MEPHWICVVETNIESSCLGELEGTGKDRSHREQGRMGPICGTGQVKSDSDCFGPDTGQMFMHSPCGRDRTDVSALSTWKR